MDLTSFLNLSSLMIRGLLGLGNTFSILTISVFIFKGDGVGLKDVAEYGLRLFPEDQLVFVLGFLHHCVKEQFGLPK